MARQEGFEPSANGLEGRCSIHLSYWRADGRGDWIRTSDPLLPRQVRYQAALHPEESVSNKPVRKKQPFFLAFVVYGRFFYTRRICFN